LNFAEFRAGEFALARELRRRSLQTLTQALSLDATLGASAGGDVFEHHVGYLARRAVEDVSDDAVPDERDLRMRERAVLHDLRRAQCVAPVNDLDLAAQARQVERLLERGVAAADDRDVLVLEEEAIAGRAR
jgi:hypothetical protein